MNVEDQFHLERLKCVFVFSAVAAKVELKTPPSVELLTQVVPVKVPDVPSVFVMPPAVTDETGEPSEPYHSSGQPADAQQLFQPIPQPQPVKPPSPPPKPQPVYSNEVQQFL